MDRASLFSLPPELRNRIYEYIFCEPRVVGIGNPKYKGKIFHPLTRVCRLLRSETLLLDCARLEVFALGYSILQPDYATAWLQRVGAKICQSLRHIDNFFCSENYSNEMIRTRYTAVNGLRVEYWNNEFLLAMEKSQVLTPWRMAMYRTLFEMGIGMRAVRLARCSDPKQRVSDLLPQRWWLILEAPELEDQAIQA